jgi:hypothetical protein
VAGFWGKTEEEETVSILEGNRRNEGERKGGIKDCLR